MKFSRSNHNKNKQIAPSLAVKHQNMVILIIVIATVQKLLKKGLEELEIRARIVTIKIRKNTEIGKNTEKGPGNLK